MPPEPASEAFDAALPDEAPSAAPTSLTHRTALAATWMIAWRMVTRVLGLVSTLIMARLLMPADFGLIAMATTFAAAVEQMSQIGLQDALVRRRGAAQELFDTAFTLQLVRGLFTAAVLVAGAPIAVWWFAEPRLFTLLLVLAGSSVIAGLENIAIADFRREMRFGVQFRLLAVPRLLQVTLTIPLALYLRSYWALLAGIIIGKIARTIMTYVVHSYRPKLRVGLRLHGWRELAAFSSWTWLTMMVGVIWDRCDPFVVGPPLGPARLGIYLLALEIALLPITEFLQPASEALFAGFASAQVHGTSSTRQAPLVSVSLFLATLPLVISVSAAGTDLVSALLGTRWAAAGPIVSILVWAGVFSPFSFTCQSVLIANGYVKRNFIANTLASFFKLAVLLIVVACTSKLATIAVATSCCVALESVVFLSLLKGTGEARLRDMRGGLMRGILAGLLTLAVLAISGLGWRVQVLPVLPAVLNGAAIGVVTLLVFATTVLAAWRLADRPEGPEASLVRLFILPALARLKNRLLRQAAPYHLS